MGVRVSAAMAAQLTGHSEKWIRAAIRSGALPAEANSVEGGRKARPEQHIGPSRWAIDCDDLAKLPGVRLNTTLLAELQAREDGSTRGLLARLAELERQVRDLQRQVRDLRAGRSSTLASAAISEARGNDALAAYGLVDDGARGAGEMGDYLPASNLSDLALSASDVISPFSDGYTPRRAVQTMRLSANLPDGLVIATAFAAQHGVPVTTAKKAMELGRLRSVQGKWKVGRNFATWALDAEGRAAFYALYGDREDFQRCAECPHNE